MTFEKDLRDMINKMNQYADYFASSIDIQLEKWDKDIDSKDHINYKKITKFINKSARNKKFFEFHTKMSTPVFGEWNYFKYM